ncbi:MAG: hypothetical protein AAF243_14670 [Cyanobacteria bacterium P01_A01_bin.137]
MDQAASSPTLDWYSPELLTEFLEELRGAGYNIGLAQYIAAHDLILALFSKNILSQPEQLEEYLGPMVCSSATEQEDFKERFAQWIQLVNSKHSAAAKKLSQSDQVLDNELEKIGKRSRKLKIALLSCIFLFPPLLWAGFRFFPSDVPPGEPTETAVPQSPANPTSAQETPEPAETETESTLENLPIPLPLTLEATTASDPLGWEALALLFLLVPIFAFAIWRAWWLLRARLFLQRRSSDQAPELANVSFQGQRELINSQILLKTSQQLRRRIRTSASSLDISRTIHESVRQGGWFTPAYGYRQVFPEYLFLVDRASVWDHQAEFAQTLVHRFANNGVYVEVFFFDADLRVCFSGKKDKPPQTLQELSAKYQHYRLVVFADADVFTNAQTAQLTDWSESLLKWENPVIITPKPLETWSREEFWVAQNFILLPMTETGIQVLGQVMQEGSAIYSASEGDSAAMPMMLRMRPKRWIERNPPTPEQAKELIVGLRNYLGDDGFYWLAACAVFPELRWNITLYLGNVLKIKEGLSLIEKCTLTNLARLPWYRYGCMPDWLRGYLIASLSIQQQKEIRAAFQELLVTAVSGSVGPIQLEIAKHYESFLPQLTKPLLRLLSRRSPENSALQDYIFLDFMSQASKLSVEIPREITPVLKEYSQPSLLNRRNFSVSLVSLVILGSLAYTVWTFYWGRQIQAAEQARSALDETRELRANGNSLDALVSATKAAQLVRNSDLGLENIENEVKLLLHELLSQIRETNRLEGHTTAIQDVSVSPNGDLFASLDTSGNLRVWNLEGQLVNQLSSEGPITAIDFGPNGELAITDSNQAIRILDGLSGEELLRVQQDLPLQILKVSPDGSRLAAVNADSSEVRILSRSNGEDIATLNHESSVNWVAFTSNGQQVVTATQTNDLQVWDANSGSLVTEFNIETGIEKIVLKSDGEVLGIADDNGDVILQPIDGGSEIARFAHGTLVNDLAFSENENSLVTASADSIIRYWSLDSGEELESTSYESEVEELAFFPDEGSLIAGRADGEIGIWKLPPLQQISSIDTNLAFSPDGRTLATTNTDNTAQLRSLDGSPLGDSLAGHEDRILSVAFSPDGQTLATASADGTARLWTLEGILIRTLEYRDAVTSVAFSPDGEMIVSGGEDGTVRLWDRSGQSLGAPFQGHTDRVWSVAFSPDGETIVSGSSDNTVRVWDRQGNPVGPPQGHTDWVWSVAFSPDGQTLATASADGTARLWTLDGTLLTTLEHREVVTSVTFSPDGQTLATASADGTTRLWTLDGEALTVSVNISLHHLVALSCFWMNDYLNSHSETTEQELKMCNTEISLPDITTSVVGLERTFNAHQSSINALALLSDQNRFLSASADATIRLWDLTTGEVIQTFTGRETFVNAISLSPDEQTLYSGSADGAIFTWNLATGEIVAEFSDHAGPVNALERTPDGEILVSGASDGTIKLWDLQTQNLIRTLEGHNGAINVLTVTDDGQSIISGGTDRTIRIWNVGTGQLVRVLEGHDSFINALAVSLDGRFLFSASADQTMKRWSLRTGELLDTLTSHTSFVNSLVVSSDGQTIYSGSADETVKAWDISTGELLRTYTGFDSPIDHLILLAEEQLITASREGPEINAWIITE